MKEIKKIIEIHEWVDFRVYLEVREGEGHSLEKKRVVFKPTYSIGSSRSVFVPFRLLLRGDMFFFKPTLVSSLVLFRRVEVV